MAGKRKAPKSAPAAGGERLGIRAYARHRGVSHTAVQKAIKDGRIFTDEAGKIDVTDADRRWDATSIPSGNPGGNPRPKVATRSRAPKAAPAREPAPPRAPRRVPAADVQLPDDIPPDSPPPADDEDAVTIDNAAISFAVGRARKELALARLRELELEVKRGELIPAEYALKQIERCLVLVAKSLDNMEGSLPPRCEGRSIGQIQAVVREEVDRMKAELFELGSSPMIDDDDSDDGSDRALA